MGKYNVELSASPGHTIPPLLNAFGTWLAKEEYGSLGYFGLVAEKPEWGPETTDRLQRDGFSFLRLPDGSTLVLLTTGAKSPPAVVLLGSEGDTSTVANSLEEFLMLLGKGETGVSDLDDEEATGRARLRAWLKENKVKAPKAKSFDFTAYLDGAPTGTTPPSQSAAAADVVAGLSPLVHRLVTLVGRRADDPELVAFVTKTLGKKLPDSTTDAGGDKNVVAKPQGIEMALNHNVKNEKYPPINKSKSSYVPYLTLVWLKPKLAEPLPFGLKHGMSIAEITSILGAPGTIGFGENRRPHWKRVLDPARDIVLGVDEDTYTIGIKEARELSSKEGGGAVLGLFVAWAIQRNLLNEARFPGHASLLTAIRQRKQKGSALVESALPRGLWDDHLKDEPGLRDFAFQWFRNIGRCGIFIRDDLVAIFGARKNKYGHDEPILDDDDWKAVDKAAKAIDKRFAQWVRM